ncbi:CDK5 regulatory subunit-associated protein 3 [Agrilus planipennis]|uniref:CDK5 regulatory subunit-associated protein 3 n=1 Tax=Agrilus planipennis TaxID=224129 RepID=A0A1W4XIP0_AGRPL|nr:CDK5 regulatory subunit-associated protein 3 [Agrilus planipennis]
MDEQHIPIDINTNKILDWLISRRHVSKDWQNNILNIREKINAAIQDMPVHEGIIKLLSGQHINYFHCLKIVDILKETEADTKNVFGRYGSQRMKDWQDIIHKYQKENLYLAEAAQILIRNVNFEVPSLKKQIAKCEQTQLDCEKKIKDYGKAETSTLNEFKQTCKQLGIPGQNIKKELIGLLDELPKIYKETASKMKGVEDAIKLYSAFVSFLSNLDRNMEVLPTLSYLIKNGNSTTYEYMYGEKPLSIESPELKYSDDESQQNAEEIDYGGDIDFGDINTENITIDFENKETDEEIDWGNLKTEDGFEIVQHSDLDVSLEESGIVVENSGLDGGIARGEEALTILDNPKTRDRILNDLIELSAFLKMRIFEMSSESSLFSISQMPDAPTILLMQTVETVTAIHDNVQIALNEINNKRLQHLHNIKHSPKYLDMLTSTLKQKLSIVERLQQKKKCLEDQIVASQAEIKKIKPILNTIISNTKVLQKQIEEEISKKYKGRPVHIVGGVNVLN